MTLKERLLEMNPDAIFYKNFDDALVGCTDIDSNIVGVYDIDRCAEIVSEGENISLDEAHEFIYNELIPSYVGVNTPIFVDFL